MGVKIRELSIITKDDYKLAGTQFTPENKDFKAVVLIASATAVKQQYYYKFANFIASKGYCVICFDYRGIGASLHGDIKKLDARISDWGEYDLNAFISWVRS